MTEANSESKQAEAAPERVLLKPEKKIAIVGCSDSKDLAPFNDESWEIWAMNNAFITTPRRTRWFEIHPIKFDGKDYWRRKLIKPGIFEYSKEFRGQLVNEYMKDLAALDIPVYMQQHWDIVPKSEAYPLQDVIHKFGNYFTNSVSYMIALAIMEGATEIGCFGVDMATACTSPEVKVLTADLRWVRADSLKVGDEIIGFDEESSDGEGRTRRWRKTVVTACPRIIKPCYKLTMEDGTEMVVSSKHGWLTHGENENRWKTQDQLITRYHRKDKPTRIVKLLNTWESDNSWETGYLAGAFDGEGHLSQMPKTNTSTHSLTIGFAQRENKMSETVERLLSKYGFQYHANETDETFKYRINGGRAESLRFLGQIRPQRLLEKFRPEILGQLTSMENVAVVSSEFIGDAEVIGLETECKTFVAEGFASHNSEYGPQRPSCEFFLGVAAGLGILLTIPPTADLLKTKFLYGFQEREQVAWEAKLSNIQKNMEIRKQHAQQEYDLAFKKIQQYIGGLEALKETERTWSNIMTKKNWSDPV